MWVNTNLLFNPPPKKLLQWKPEIQEISTPKTWWKLAEEKLTVCVNKICHSALWPKSGFKHRCTSQNNTAFTAHFTTVHRWGLTASAGCSSLLYLEPGPSLSDWPSPAQSATRDLLRCWQGPISGRNTWSLIAHTKQTHQAHSRKVKPLMTHSWNNQGWVWCLPLVVVLENAWSWQIALSIIYQTCRLPLSSH